MSLADALAFENFTEEQKRIAYAGVMLHEQLDAAHEEGRVEGFDAGKLAAYDEMVHGGDATLIRDKMVVAEIAALRDEFAVLLALIHPNDSRHEVAKGISLRLGALLRWTEERESGR